MPTIWLHTPEGPPEGRASVPPLCPFADVVMTRAVEEIIVEPALLVSFRGWMRQQRATCDAALYNYSLHLRDLFKSLGWEKIRAGLMLTRCGSLSWIPVKGADGHRQNSAPRPSACFCDF